MTIESQNITLSLPKSVLTKVKLLAVQRNQSVSGLLTEMLEAMVMMEDAYWQARRRHEQWLDNAPDLGTQGITPTTRDELHER